MTDKPKPKRRWLQFSLRTLFIVVTVFCVWMGVVTKRARDQRLAVEAVVALGGKVYYSHQRTRNVPNQGITQWNPQLESRGPRWLKRLIGDEYFQSVAQVDLSGTEADDEFLRNLSGLPKLQVVSLRKTNVEGEGLWHLRNAVTLESLDLFYQDSLQDQDLMHLRKLSRLRGLFLLGSDQITDDGVANLAHLIRLEQLGLANTQITDEGLSHLTSMTKLTQLVLDDTQVTDDGLRHLRNLTNLYWLNLTGTKITDNGLRHLAHMRKLWQVVLWDTNVTEEGVAYLKQELPNLEEMPIGPRP